MASLFVSDVHLSPARPEIVRLFRSFLLGPARAADALYILGDLFDAWAGDDDLSDPFVARVAGELADCARSGVAVHFMRGNRDFLVGAGLAATAGLELLEDPTPIVLHGRRVLLTHGDELCTDDTAYQDFRRQVRSRAWIDAFLSRPLADRKREIESLRSLSESEKRRKDSQIMDVNAAAVEALLRRHDYPTLVHGHTHRPATHTHRVDGHVCERWVLADWYDRGSYLAGTDFGLRVETLAAQEDGAP